MDRFFTQLASRIASFSGSPTAFVAAFGTVIVWGISGPLFGFSEVWQLVINTGTTIVTFLMIFLVQNSQNRDSAAMEAKLDELLRGVEEARADSSGSSTSRKQKLRTSALGWKRKTALKVKSRRRIMPWRDCFPGVRSSGLSDGGGGHLLSSS